MMDIVTIGHIFNQGEHMHWTREENRFHHHPYCTVHTHSLRTILRWPQTGYPAAIHAAVLFIVLCAFSIHGKTAVPVFLLCGQSNMSGYASANDLSADQKTTVEQVKIYADMTWEGDNSKKKQWLTLGPGFGSGAGKIGPELAFGRALSKQMPDVKIALLKICCGSTYLGNYPSKPNDCWVPPSSNNGNAGAHYKRMLASIETAMKAFNSAFDTSQYTPQWAGFIWLQGEFDGQDRTLADAYEKNLTNLINDVRKDLKVDDLPFIIPMIDVQNSWQYNSTVRAAEVAVTKSLENVDTVDTKGFETDGAHYRAQGQEKIGTRCADRWMAMDYNYSGKVSVNAGLFRAQRPESLYGPSSSTVDIFDASGRKIRSFNRERFHKMANRSFMGEGVFILHSGHIGNEKNSFYVKIVSIGK